jgi:UDP-N-acetylmuramyl pentapeptide synthase
MLVNKWKRKSDYSQEYLKTAHFKRFKSHVLILVTKMETCSGCLPREAVILDKENSKKLKKWK